MGGCIGRFLLLALVLGAGVLAWQHRDRLMTTLDDLRGRELEVSPELAAVADSKLATLSVGDGVRRVALTAPELQSLIEYRWGGLLPPDVSEPRVDLGKGRVILEATVATARFGRVSELREIVGFLPDTTTLRAAGSFIPLDDGRVGLEVHDLSAAGIPLPRQLIPPILARFPGSGEQDLPPNALAIPLPPGIRTIFVSGDTMVFVGNLEQPY